MRETFGEVLRRLRLARGLSQRQVAIRYGILQGKEHGATTSLISGWESNSRNATRDSIALLAQALKAAPEEHDELLIAAGYLPKSSDAVSAVYVALRSAGDISDLSKQMIRDYVEKIVAEEKKEEEGNGE